MAGGEHKGIVINKDGGQQEEGSTTPHLCLEFRVFLVNSNTGKHAQVGEIKYFPLAGMVERGKDIRC